MDKLMGKTSHHAREQKLRRITAIGCDPKQSTCATFGIGGNIHVRASAINMRCLRRHPKCTILSGDQYKCPRRTTLPATPIPHLFWKRFIYRNSDSVQLAKRHRPNSAPGNRFFGILGLYF
jgi:hypothetical protein